MFSNNLKNLKDLVYKINTYYNDNDKYYFIAEIYDYTKIKYVK